jgi:hypothetical protein
MDGTTVRAGKFLWLHFCGWPEFLLNGAASIGELGGGRATDKETLNIKSSLFRARPGPVK